MSTPVDDLESRIAALKNTPVPTGAGVEAAKARGRVHRRRTRLQTGMGAMAVTALAVVGVLNLPSTTTDLDAPGAFATEGSDGAAVTTGGFEWSAVAEAVGGGRPVFGPDGTLYVVSTSPELTAYPEDGSSPEWLLWASDDAGENWASSSLTDFAQELWVHDLVATDDGLYVVGTAAPTVERGAATVRMGRSTDADTWEQIDLALTARAPEGTALVGQVTTAMLASGPDVTAVLAQTAFWVDPTPFIPGAFSSEEDGYVAYPTDLGVEVYDQSQELELARACEDALAELAEEGTDVETLEVYPEPCNVAEVGSSVLVWAAAWEELGLNPDDLRLDELFLSTDGVTFTPAEFPTGLAVISLDWAGGAFYALAHVPGTGSAFEVWRSVDGTGWTQVGMLPSDSWLTAVGAVGDTLVTVGENGAVVMTSTDGGASWDAAPLSELVELPEGLWATSWQAGPAGLAIALSSFEVNSAAFVATSSNLTDFQVERLDGGEYGTYIEGVAVGADAIFANAGSWRKDGAVDFIARSQG
jgi:hypothetical protein